MADLDCYVRVSRVSGREGDSFISPELQRERCEAHAKLHGHRIVNVVVELDASGGDDGRPGWQAMLSRVEAGEVGGVIVARLDRFSRSVSGALAALQRIHDANGIFVSVGDHIDASSPTGRLVLNVLLAMAQWQREDAAAGFRAARERAVRRGVHVSTRVPFGYKRADGRGHGLTIDEQTAPVVLEVFERRARGGAYAPIYRDLNARGITTIMGGQWTAVNLSQMISNPVYKGQARSGDIVNDAAHEAIVTADLWDRAQGSESATPHRERKSLLAGIIRCAGCRRSLTGGGGVAYFCHAQHASGRCPAPASIRQRFVDAYVTEQFLARAAAIEIVAMADTVELERLRSDLDHAAAELEAWRDTISVVDVGADLYKAGLIQRQQALEAAEISYHAEVNAGRPQLDLPDPWLIGDLWEHLEVAERRSILAAAIDVVFLRGGRAPVADRVHIVWRGEGKDLDLPRPAKVSPIVPFVFPDADGEVVVGVAS